MAKFLFANNATGYLNASITNVATSIVLQAGQGALFPSPTGTDVFYATLYDGVSTIEIVKVTARSTDTLTVVRAQEGTSASAFASGSSLELAVTKGVLENFVQTSGSSSLTIADNVLSIYDDGDATKILQFQCSSITAGNTRTVTIPDSNTRIPIASQFLTFSGPTAARTITIPDANWTAARTDAAQSFTGLQTFSTGITSTAASNTLGSATVSGTWTGSGSPTFTSMGSWSGTTGAFSSTLSAGGNVTFTNGVLTMGGANAASTGSIRFENSSTLNFRNAANSADITALTLTASDSVTLRGGAATVTSTGINSTAIGATTASTGAFTTLSATGLITGAYGSNSTPSMILGDAQYGIYVSSGILYLKSSAGTNFGFRNAADTGNTLLVNANGIVAAADSSIPAGGTAGKGLMVSSASNFGVFFGSGAPTLSAAQGSLYLRSNGTTTNNRAYINTDGGTTWTALTTAA